MPVASTSHPLFARFCHKLLTFKKSETKSSESHLRSASSRVIYCSLFNLSNSNVSFHLSLILHVKLKLVYDTKGNLRCLFQITHSTLCSSALSPDEFLNFLLQKSMHFECLSPPVLISAFFPLNFLYLLFYFPQWSHFFYFLIHPEKLTSLSMLFQSNKDDTDGKDE